MLLPQVPQTSYRTCTYVIDTTHLSSQNLNIYHKSSTDLNTAAVMQHEMCITARVCGNNCHPKQPRTINKLRTNQRFELRNEQGRHWSSQINEHKFTFTLRHKRLSTAQRIPLCLAQKPTESSLLRGSCAVRACNPSMLHEHAGNHARFVLH